MKQNKDKYTTVEKLPLNAMTVKEYAESKNITTQYVYAMIKRNKANFKIVTFQSINFIIS
jgi:hypothetical protein